MSSFSATKIDGKATAAILRGEVTEQTKELLASHSVTPGLAVVLVGERPDSATYVRMKKKAAAEIGFLNVDVQLPEDVTQERLLEVVDELNGRSTSTCLGSDCCTSYPNFSFVKTLFER